jgi:hypothetical protein
VAALRLTFAVLLVWAFPRLELLIPVVILAIAVVATALAYEWLRRPTRRTSGRTARPHPLDVAVWILVGAGYAIRGTAGLVMATGVPGHVPLIAATGVTLWCFGVAFVTQTWALEATTLAEVTGTRARWPADFSERQHILALSRWIPEDIDSQDLCPPRRQEAASHQPLTHRWKALRSATAWPAPWNISTLAGGAAAGCTGVLLTHGYSATDTWLAAAAGLVATVPVALISRQRLSLTLAATLLLVGFFVVLGVSPAWLAVLPWVVVVGVYAGFSEQCWQTLKHPFDGVLDVLQKATSALARMLLGRETWDELTRSRPHREP